MEYTYTKLREKLRNSTNKVSPVVLWKSESENYPNIYLLVQSLFVLPYSSVPVERIFSNLKDIKTPKRNRLTLDNLEACLMGYQHSKSEIFSISEEMKENYKKKKVLVSKVIKEEKKNINKVLIEKGIWLVH